MIDKLHKFIFLDFSRLNMKSKLVRSCNANWFLKYRIVTKQTIKRVSTWENFHILKIAPYIYAAGGRNSQLLLFVCGKQ